MTTLDPRRVLVLDPRCYHMTSSSGETAHSRELCWSKVHQVKGNQCFQTLFYTILRRGKKMLRHYKAARLSITSATFEFRRNTTPLRLFFVVLLFSCARLGVYSCNFRTFFKETANPSTPLHLIHYGTTSKTYSWMEPSSSGLYTASSMDLTCTRLE